MSLICLVPPPIPAVDLTELKSMLRMSASDKSQDDVLTGLNAAAQTWCETILERKLVQQTWRLGVDFFPGYIDTKLVGQKVSSPFVSGANAILVGIRYAFMLPYPPCQAVVNFTYQDQNGEIQTMTTPTNFIQDLTSQPARLTPLFGQMWPVARVVVDAVNIDFQCGYATPFVVGATDGEAVLTGAAFTAANVGAPISIPGAGLNGGVLNTIVASVDDSGVATLRDAPQTSGANVTALLVTNGDPGYWELCKTAIKFLVNSWYVNRLPSFDQKTRDCVKAILGPARDLRL